MVQTAWYKRPSKTTSEKAIETTQDDTKWLQNRSNQITATAEFDECFEKYNESIASLIVGTVSEDSAESKQASKASKQASKQASRQASKAL